MSEAVGTRDAFGLLHPNISLQIPEPRSQFVKYAAISYLLDQSNPKPDGYEGLLSKLGLNNAHLKKLSQDFQKWTILTIALALTVNLIGFTFLISK